MAEKRQAIEAAQAALKRAEALLEDCLSVWATCLERTRDAQVAASHELLEATLALRSQSFGELATTLRSQIELLRQGTRPMLPGIDEQTLRDLSSAAEQLIRQAGQLAALLDDEIDGLKRERVRLETEIETLEQGVYPFPREVINLREAIETRLSARFGPAEECRVFIVAEEADVTDDRWRNALEGYLYREKHHVVVAPAHYEQAAEVLAGIRRKNPTGILGLVDSAGADRAPTDAGRAPTTTSSTSSVPAAAKTTDVIVAPGSLAELITSPNALVQDYLNRVLGRLMRCSSRAHVQNHDQAITANGLLYEDCTLISLDPQYWERPAIGQDAIKRRLEAARTELSLLNARLSGYTVLSEGFSEVGLMRQLAQTDVLNMLQSAEDFRQIPHIEQELKELEDDLTAIDTSAAQALIQQIARLEGRIVEIEDNQKNAIRQQGECQESLRAIRSERLPSIQERIAQTEALILATYCEDWVACVAQPRYERELAQRGEDRRVEEAFPRELSKAQNARVAAWDVTRDLRREYNDRYKMGLPVEAATNDDFDQALSDLSEVRLPAYLESITDARKKALEQFQEDFLSRLQSNIHSVRQQIDELNRALGSSSFGEDRYRFRVSPRDEYRRFYDMIVDEMLIAGGYNLLSDQFNRKYESEIADLFAIITSGGEGQGLGSDEYEQRVRVFTDYRTYLDFDLEVISPDGTTQRLSRTLGKKSGGETQTPFYIAVLASFVQLYRIGSDRQPNTARLILFDEAFSKMDSERIVNSIALLKQFDFQVILSAPPEKVDDIATLVDRNLLVWRQGHDVSVHAFDPRRVDDAERRAESSGQTELS
jgi:cell division protein FtsB